MPLPERSAAGGARSEAGRRAGGTRFLPDCLLNVILITAPHKERESSMIWLQLVICCAIILLAGSRLSRYGELIAEKSGLSKSLVGLVLLAIITSLSQLVASVSSVVLHDLPDVAVGALVGSCMFNMMLIGLLDLVSTERPVSSFVHVGHILSAGFGIILLGFVAIDITFGSRLPVFTWIHSMDPITIAFVPVYFFAMRLTFRFESKRIVEYEEEQAKSEHVPMSWFRLIALFSLCAIAIVLASSELPAVAEGVAKMTGWGQSFIGTAFIAVATCLPELSVSVSAARRGSFDLAVASLLGSNLCYIVILAITDFCYWKAPLLRHVSSMNALTAMSAMISMAIVVIALTYRPAKKIVFIAGDAVALILIYILTNVLLFASH